MMHDMMGEMFLVPVAEMLRMMNRHAEAGHGH